MTVSNFENEINKTGHVQYPTFGFDSKNVISQVLNFFIQIQIVYTKNSL